MRPSLSSQNTNRLVRPIVPELLCEAHALLNEWPQVLRALLNSRIDALDHLHGEWLQDFGKQSEEIPGLCHIDREVDRSI